MKTIMILTAAVALFASDSLLAASQPIQQLPRVPNYQQQNFNRNHTGVVVQPQFKQVIVQPNYQRPIIVISPKPYYPPTNYYRPVYHGNNQYPFINHGHNYPVNNWNWCVPSWFGGFQFGY